MDKVTKWYIKRRKGGPRILRTHYGPNTRKDEFLPLIEYRHLLDKPHELRRFVMRLNNIDERKLLALENLEKKDAFFADSDLEEFKSQLIGRYSSEKDALVQFNYLKQYSLAFFYSKGFISPQSMKLHEFEWGQVLIGKGEMKFERQLAPKTIKYIVNVTNNFLAFLHRKYRDIPLIKLQPLTRAQLKNYTVEYKQSPERRTEGRYVSPEELDTILKLAPNDGMRAAIKLCYYYGLRRAEVFGLTPQSVKKGYLVVENQIDPKTGKLKPLKDREARRVDHLWLTPLECAGLVKTLMESDLTYAKLGNFFSKDLLKNKIELDVHSLRRSFITNALLKGIEPVKVQAMAGHSDLHTTSKYVRDARQFTSDDDETVVI